MWRWFTSNPFTTSPMPADAVKDLEIPCIEKFVREIPGPGRQVIVGGSFGLRTYLRKKFQYDDIDIVCSSFNPDGVRPYTLSKDLLEEEKLLREVYPTAEIVTKFVRDRVQESERSRETEEFDEYIIGSINVKLPDSPTLQFVWVNKASDELADWYAQVSDLPAFCLLHCYAEPEYAVKNPFSAKAAEYGILLGLKHEYRKEKYRKKGFTVY